MSVVKVNMLGMTPRRFICSKISNACGCVRTMLETARVRYDAGIRSDSNRPIQYHLYMGTNKSPPRLGDG